MSIVYYNGEYVDGNISLVPYDDCGFTTGIGIFDSMLVSDGSLVHSAEHYERLVHDTKTVIGLSVDLTFEGFSKICIELINKNNLGVGYARVRTTITGGQVSAPLAPAANLNILIHVARASNPDDMAPITCVVVDAYPRIAGCVLENCKRLDYSRSYAARREAERAGAEEAILTNTDGNIACGATSNIFIEEAGVLVTPPLNDGVLAGVTRRMLIAERDIKEESISIARLEGADRIYLTNSFFGLRDVELLKR